MIDTKKLLELSAASLPNLTSDVVVIINKTGNILYVNERMETWLGYKQEELVGQNLTKIKILSATSLPTALKNLAARHLGKDIPAYRLEFITKSGKRVSATIRAQLILDENGETVGDLVVITEAEYKEQIEGFLDNCENNGGIKTVTTYPGNQKIYDLSFR